MKKFAAVSIFVISVFILMFLYSAQQEKTSMQPLPQVPAPGLVTMVNLGTESCLPCQMMEPAMEELKATYKDKAKIAFIDVWKHTDQGQRFRITTIPTQVFFDHQGIEMHRHQGYMDKQSIIDVLENLLEIQALSAENRGVPAES